MKVFIACILLVAASANAGLIPATSLLGTGLNSAYIRTGGFAYTTYDGQPYTPIIAQPQHVAYYNHFTPPVITSPITYYTPAYFGSHHFVANNPIVGASFHPVQAPVPSEPASDARPVQGIGATDASKTEEHINESAIITDDDTVTVEAT